MSVCLYVCLSVCRSTVTNTITKFSEHHPVVERVDNFEHGYRGLRGWCYARFTVNCWPCRVFKCQAVDPDNKSQRATKLVDILSRHCDDVSVFCKSLIAVRQQRLVDKYFTGKHAESLNVKCIKYTIRNGNWYISESWYSDQIEALKTLLMGQCQIRIATDWFQGLNLTLANWNKIRETIF